MPGLTGQGIGCQGSSARSRGARGHVAGVSARVSQAGAECQGPERGVGCQRLCGREPCQGVHGRVHRTQGGVARVCRLQGRCGREAGHRGMETWGRERCQGAGRAWQTDSGRVECQGPYDRGRVLEQVV